LVDAPPNFYGVKGLRIGGRNGGRTGGMATTSLPGAATSEPDEMPESIALTVALVAVRVSRVDAANAALPVATTVTAKTQINFREFI
jgi:hypothetical protein